MYVLVVVPVLNLVPSEQDQHEEPRGAPNLRSSHAAQQFLFVQMDDGAAPEPQPPLRVAILGCGLAGCATAWGLLQLPRQGGGGSTVHVTLFDGGAAPGGRCATRKPEGLPGLAVNHGPQSVLRVPFYHILTLPRVPLDFVWTGSVRDVVPRFAKNSEVFIKKAFRQAIKLKELYSLTKKYLKAHIQNFDRKRGTTSRSLFCSRVPYSYW